MPLEGHCIGFLWYFWAYSFCDGWWVMRQRFIFWKACGRENNLYALNFQIFSELWKLQILLFHQSLVSFSWNLNFHHNLTNLGIENLERPVSFLSHVHLSPFVLYVRVWSLSSIGLFAEKSFLLNLSNLWPPMHFSLTKFISKSKASYKAKAYAWLVANKKVNTNDLL